MRKRTERQVDRPSPGVSGVHATDVVPLPPELDFLPFDVVDRKTLADAARQARVEMVCAVRVLIATGRLAASAYYQELAAHLGLPFVDGWPKIEPSADVTASTLLGFVELSDESPMRWLAAPQDQTLLDLLSEHRSGRRWHDLAIATPAHLASILHYYADRTIERAASHALPTESPRLSAKDVCGKRTMWPVIVALGCLFIIWYFAARPVLDLLGVLFLVGISFRIILCANGLEPLRGPAHHLSDAELPFYTVLVPLRAEADIVPDLLAALEALDYPRAKLEVLVLIEPEDLATRAALKSARLPPWLHVVFGPIGGELRTKPRALNIGLLSARGTLLTIFDAEDRPSPNQLRQAAALFAESSGDLACLQARLSIDNGDRSLLARMFAIEYAALFDILNVGISHLRLPMALGGTSCHFRTSVLRDVGGWDAWNVTEDADLGLRLARLGAEIASMPSTTFEAAPEKIGSWMKQRRRWTKGWMQTFIVLARDAPQVARQLGPKRTVALTLLLTNLVVGPLLFPLFSACVLYRLSTHGIANPSNLVEVAEATIEAAVVMLGVVSTFWSGYIGLRARGLGAFLPSLPLLIPYQLMISVAAWWGLWDLVLRPHHWHKTMHPARARGREKASA